MRGGMYPLNAMYPYAKRKKTIVSATFRRVMLMAVVAVAGATLPAWACTTCNRPLQDAIFTADFPPTLLKMFLPLLLLAFVVRLLFRLR